MICHRTIGPTQAVVLPVDDAAELVPVLARWLAVVPWGRA